MTASPLRSDHPSPCAGVMGQVTPQAADDLQAVYVLEPAAVPADGIAAVPVVVDEDGVEIDPCGLEEYLSDGAQGGSPRLGSVGLA